MQHQLWRDFRESGNQLSNRRPSRGYPSLTATRDPTVSRANSRNTKPRTPTAIPFATSAGVAPNTSAASPIAGGATSRAKSPTERASPLRYPLPDPGADVRHVCNRRGPLYAISQAVQSHAGNVQHQHGAYSQQDQRGRTLSEAPAQWSSSARTGRRLSPRTAGAESR